MEFVYVVKRYDLFDLAFPHGFHGRGDDGTGVTLERYLERIRTRGFFIERRRAEQDSSFKQIIPYAIVTAGEEVFLLRRFATQGEARLHNKLSIGVGGHINPVDGETDVLMAGAHRELAEELDIADTMYVDAIGTINDESNPVGSVHSGVVCRVRVKEKNVTVREREKMDGAFVHRDELTSLCRREGERFETWSRLIIERLDEALA